MTVWLHHPSGMGKETPIMPNIRSSADLPNSYNFAHGMDLAP